jgi:hypothetical protein
VSTELEKFNEVRRLRGKPPVTEEQFNDAMAKARSKSAPQTGLLGQAGRGLGDVATGYASLADTLGKASQFAPGKGLIPGMSILSELESRGGTRGLARRGVGAIAGPDVSPQTPAQGYARAGGRALGALPMSMATGGGGMGLNLASNVLGEGAGEYTRQAGGGRLLQLLASMGAGILPGAAKAALTTGPIGNRLAEPLSQETREIAAENVADATLRAPIGSRMPQAMDALAAESDDATAASRYGTRLSTPQALARIAPGMEGVEADVQRRVGTLGAEMLDDRVENLGKLQAHYQRELARGGNAAATKTALDSARNGIARDVDAAFNQTDLGTELTVSTKPLLAGPATIRAEVAREGGWNAQYMPEKLMSEIEEMGDSTSLAALRGLEKRISNELFAARDVPTTSRYLSILADEVDSTFDRVAKAGGADAEAVNNLRKAVALRRRAGELFNASVKVPGQKERVPNVVVKAFDRFEDPADAVRDIIKSPRPIENLERLRASVGDQPGAWEGVQSVVHRKVFGDDFDEIFEGADTVAGAKAIDSVIARVKKEHDVYNYVMGDTRAAKNSIDFLERLRQAKTVGVAGTKEATRRTMSAVAEDTAKKKWANAAEVAAHLSGGLRNVAFSVLRLGGHTKVTMAEADRLIAKAIRDPKFGRWFLELRPRRELPRFRDQISSFLAPSAVRGGAAMSNEKERR